MTSRIILLGVVISAIVAVAAAGLASGSPDGLERVAEDQGFIETAQDPGYEILPDYTIPGVEHPLLSTAIAGIVGVLVVAGLVVAAGHVLRRHEVDPPGNA
ncbi:MAG: PDGLE domain-containing protein [Dehalococcoidia bacterium]